MMLAQFAAPPSPRMFNYPVAFAGAFIVVFTTVLLFVSGKFDPSGGVLTISLLIVVAFVGVTALCVLFTIPNDETTGAVIGGLTAAMGAVIVYWLGRPRGPPS